MARSTKPNADAVYSVVERFVDECLRTDGSLFTPGRPIWTAANAQVIRERFIDAPDESSDSFLEKLGRQLDGAEPGVVQFMAEVVYVHLLAAAGIQGDTKRRVLGEIADLSAEAVPIPDDLDGVLDYGLFGGGLVFTTLRWLSLRFLVSFVQEWKALTDSDRAEALADPWAFKAVVSSADLSNQGQAQALLHMVFPDTFEWMVSLPHKKQIRRAFSSHVSEGVDDVDAALLEIREALGKEYGPSFTFHEPPVVGRWNPDWTVAGEAEEDESASPARLRAWLVRGANVDGRNLIPTWLDRGFCSIGWDELDELPADVTRTELVERMREAYPDASAGTIGNSAGQILRFVKMAPGDLIVSPDGSNVYVGQVISGPRKELDGPPSTSLRRDVGWANAESPIDRKELPDAMFSKLRTLLTVSDVSDDAAEYVRMAGLDIEVAELVDREPKTLQIPEVTDDLAEELFVPREWLEEIGRLLTAKRQLVFYGPPGTGKTFIARRLAKHLISENGTYKLVQFHPSYTYEDFFEGFRPRQAADGQMIGFELVPGPLRQIAEEAHKDPAHPYVLIIDEINRANLAKVFGELYFLLEYRDEGMALQYSPGEDFRLPTNLFVIGTMNTADRSIALVDAAMRRRFYFVPFFPTRPPIDDLLRAWLADRDLDPATADLLDVLNERMGEEDFSIGPSYLMTEDAATPDGQDRVWEHGILPLLEEHFLGTGVDVAERFGLDSIRKQVQRRAGALSDAGEAGTGPDESVDAQGSGSESEPVQP